MTRTNALERAMGTAEALLIAEAGRQFPASLDLDVTLRNIGTLVVGWMADWCILDVVEPDGRLTRTSAAAMDPAAADLRNAYQRLSLDAGRPSLLRDALESRMPVLISDVDDEHLSERAQSAEHLKLLRAMGLTSYIAVPLVASGELVGGLLIGSSSGRLGAGELATAESVGRLAALAIHNACSHETTRKALEARDDRLAVVAHDLRAPLSNAMFAAGLLRLRLREGGAEGLDTLLDLIEGSVRHMTRLISDLTDLVGLQSGRLSIVLQPVPVADLVAEASSPFTAHAEAAGIRLGTDVGEACGEVAVDRTRIVQVFSNLIGNALKFTDRGGAIRVSARRYGGVVRFSVADTGIGIPAEALSRIFEPFWRGPEQKGGGLGLGLTIVRDIIELHGGAVRVDSRPGRGTEVSFELAPA